MESKKKKYFINKRLKYILSRACILNWFAIAGFDFYITYYAMEDAQYKRVFYDMIDILQIGLIGNGIILMFLFAYKFCWYNKIPVIGLILLNFINLYFTTGEETEAVYEIYGHIVTHTFMVLTSIWTLLLMLFGREKL